MEIKQNLCANVIRKIALLITKASDLNMDMSGYGFADENQSFGNVYIWLENYPFCLYIGLCGDDEIMANWTSPEDGEEFDTEVDGKTLDDLYDFCKECENKKED